jgi:TPR repeat protein
LENGLEPYFGGLKEKWSSLGGAGKGLLATVVIVIAAVLLLWAVDRILLFFFAQSYVGEIAQVFNLDQHFARALALVVWALIIFFLSKLFSLSRASRRFGFFGLLALLAGHALLLSHGTRDQFFEANSGEATKCYVLTRDGEVRYLENPGVDPVTGRTCRVYTQETAERLQAYAKGKRPERIFQVEPSFFDLRTGEPIVWYWRDKDGRVELFNLMGFHPESGEELQPVNPDVIKAYKDQTQRIISPPQRIVDIENYQLFDTATGHPRAWFWRGPNGEYEFFDNQGFNPTNGEALNQFTSEEIARWKKERQLAKEYNEQEERKRLETEQLRRDMEERRQTREREAAERTEKAEAEKQRKVAEAIDRCDQLAANPHDPKKPANILGARFAEVKENAEEAVFACRKSVEYFPEEPRYKYQYARALSFSKPDEAIVIYRRLAAQIYPAAFDNLASLLLQRRDKKSIRQAITVLEDGVRNGDPDAMVTLAALAGTSELPVKYPYAYKLMLLKKAASLGNQDAQEAADELERQAQQRQQEYISQRQQEQMMLDVFGNIVGGVLRGR